jgi:hypothetical protein
MSGDHRCQRSKLLTTQHIWSYVTRLPRQFIFISISVYFDRVWILELNGQSADPPPRLGRTFVVTSTSSSTSFE